VESSGAAAEALAALGGVWDGCVRFGLVLEFPVFGADGPAPDVNRLAPPSISQPADVSPGRRPDAGMEAPDHIV
jgi:hypothetical protein